MFLHIIVHACNTSKQFTLFTDMTEETNNQPASILVLEHDKEPGPGFSNPSQSNQFHQLQKDNYNDTALEVIDLTNQRHVCYPHIPLYPNNVQLSDYTSAVSYYVQPGFSTQVDPANFNFSRQQQQSFCDANLSQQASSVESYGKCIVSFMRQRLSLNSCVYLRNSEISGPI